MSGQSQLQFARGHQPRQQTSQAQNARVRQLRASASQIQQQQQLVRDRFPAGSRKEATLRRHVLTIDSRSRDSFATTTASNYRVRFPAIGQVKKMRLISTEIPNTQYVINVTNKFIDFIDVGGGGAPVVVTLTEGSYTALELANEISLQLNTAVGVGFGVEFAVTYLTFQKKLRIERIAGGNFTLLWTTGATAATNAAQPLGFTQDYVNVSLAISDQVVDLGGENYVNLQIRGFPTIANTEGIEDVFAKIIWNVPPNFITYDSFVANDIVFPNPINLLDSLDIKFVRQDGQLYEFNKVQHSFSIELWSIVQN